MAKKNSTKTATKEALQASEPKILAFKGWTGINTVDSPIGWDPEETDARAQSDLKNTFFTVQNNLITTSGLTVETRKDDMLIGMAPENTKFTGVSCVFEKYIFCALANHKIVYKSLLTPDAEWSYVNITDNAESKPDQYDWTEISYHCDNLICLNEQNIIFLGDLSHIEDKQIEIVSTKPIPNPNAVEIPGLPKLDLTPKGDLQVWKDNTGDIESEDDIDPELSPTRVRICYTYTNKFGSTIASVEKSEEYNYHPVTWSGGRYLRISQDNIRLPEGVEVEGVDIFTADNNSIVMSIAGHADIKKNDDGTISWSFNYTGAAMDTSQWSMSEKKVPASNSTSGVAAKYCTCINGRLYFWGDNAHLERVYVGGLPGWEFSVALGHGGAFIDIEPGNGNIVNGVCWYKTASGANIPTMLCGNKNTGAVKRFNLVETNVTITNEIQSAGYMFEEVSNTIGCNSRWGFGVFEDGLYCISRWGLGVTTMAMEYSSQMRVAYVSSNIEDLFTDYISNNLQNSHMCYIHGVVYIALVDVHSETIFCYDIPTKSWYTETIKRNEDNEYPILKHILSIDSDETIEGLGYVCEDRVGMIPLTGEDKAVTPDGFICTLMTPELSNKAPLSGTHYLCQLEFRFDYLIADAAAPLEIIIEGIDYYGRHFNVYKKVDTKNEMKREYPVWMRVDKLVETYRIVIKAIDKIYLAGFYV